MPSTYRYLTESSPKTIKGEALNYLTAILYLAPFKSSGVANVCPFASAGCVATCLNTAGRAGIMRKGETTNVIQEARKRKTRDFFANRAEFLAAVDVDIHRLKQRARRLSMKPAVRLNGTSDLRFDLFARFIFDNHPDVQFYDYTKDMGKVRDYVSGRTPRNYHVTFSYSENVKASDIEFCQSNGVNIATAFIGDAGEVWKSIPAAGEFAPTVDGDAHDLRFLDGDRGAIVALKAKGKAKRDTSGFVVRTAGGRQ